MGCILAAPFWFSMQLFKTHLSDQREKVNIMPEQQDLPQQKDKTGNINKIYSGGFHVKTIDDRVLAGYNAGIERNRLRTGLGLIEFERTKELLMDNLPLPPAVIYDIGGGYGEYSWWLASLGYEVHLFDISETNIAMSEELSSCYPGVSLAAREISDAREIARADESADAILFMGPLYHIVEKSERLLAIKECYRLLKKSGVLFSAAITPYATLLWATTVFGAQNRLLEEDAFMHMITRELVDGEHIWPVNSSYKGMGRSHFHSANELKDELFEGGFHSIIVHGVVGGAWLAPNIDELWKNPDSREALMRTVRMLDMRDDIVGLSTHILAVSHK